MISASTVASMRLLGRAVRLLFSRRDPARIQALAVELARSTAARDKLDDPVRAWEPRWQVDRGLGRARRLQRLFSSPAWRNHGVRHHEPEKLQDNAADCLFAAAMNLAHQAPLSDEAHIFRLWYLAARAESPPENAQRLFGELRDLPPHQQLAAGARMLQAVTSSAPGESSSSRPRLSPQRSLTNQTVDESG